MNQLPVLYILVNIYVEKMDDFMKYIVILVHINQINSSLFHKNTVKYNCIAFYDCIFSYKPVIFDELFKFMSCWFECFPGGS